MKRIIIFLTVLVLILTLSGCAKKNELLDLESDVKISQRDDTSFTTEKTEYSTDVEVIKYTITYTGEGESACSPYAGLQKKQDGEWKQLAYKGDVTFLAYAYVLKPNEPCDLELNLEDYYNLPLEAGEYRLFEGENNYIMVSNTFEVK